MKSAVFIAKSDKLHACNHFQKIRYTSETPCGKNYTSAIINANLTDFNIKTPLIKAGINYTCVKKPHSSAVYEQKERTVTLYQNYRSNVVDSKAKYTNTENNIGIAIYRNVFGIIINNIDDYEEETYRQTKCATYKKIQAWVKQKYGLHDIIKVAEYI